MPVEEDEWPEDDVLEPPSDITDVAPVPNGPPLSSSAPGDSTDPHPVSDETLSDVEEPEPIPEFDPRVREDFEGLMYLGRLTHEFPWGGHRFLIKTLSTDEILEIGLLHKEFLGTVADVKAYQTLVVAAAVVQVDGKSLGVVPITKESTDTMLLNRYHYVRRNWFPPTIDAVYEEYAVLEDRVEKAIAAMGEAHGLTGSTLTSNGTSV